MNLKDLSVILELSQTTVSRALNGYPEVNEVTRQRVVEAARLHGYMPNTHATRLATGVAKAIAHVIPVSNQKTLMDPIFTDFIAGAFEIYEREGYEMTLSIVSDETIKEKCRRLFAAGTCDGIIVSGPRVGDQRIRFLNRIGIPFLVHGRSSMLNEEYSWMDINNFSAFQTATEHLLLLGHRRIALLNGSTVMDFAYRRLRGYSAALHSRGIEVDPTIIKSDEMIEPFGFLATKSLMRGPNPPTALLTSSTLIATGAWRALQELQLKPGKDVSIVTHDDELGYFGNAKDQPLFTAVHSSIRKAGRRCAEMILSLIRNPRQQPITELWEVDFVEGPSTGTGPYA